MSVGNVGHLGSSHVGRPVAPTREHFLSVLIGLRLEDSRMVLLHEVLFNRFTVQVSIVCLLLGGLSDELGLESADSILSLTELLRSLLKLYGHKLRLEMIQIVFQLTFVSARGPCLVSLGHCYRLYLLWSKLNVSLRFECALSL